MSHTSINNADTNYARTKLSCYFAYLSMASVFSLPPILFVTFRDMYGISYTLLGTLVLINFCTQLSIDLIFSFFSKYFNITKTVRIMPVLTTTGLLIYAIVPTLLPQYAYVGLVIGTVIFSVSAGLSEVLLSPLIAAIPSEHPEKDMSLLHSLYAWGVLLVVVISTIFLSIFGRENWMYLTVFLALFPLVAAYLFATSPIPAMDVSQSGGTGSSKSRNLGMALCVGCIFLGSCAENTMSNWISGYMENALLVPKALGDLFGTALFAVLLGTARTLYGKFGGNIYKVLLISMTGAFLCYLTIGLAQNVMLSFLACVLTGCFTAMLWPGTLILMEEKIPGVGVAAYALMAAGGDFGASLAPQMLGIVVDKVTVSTWAADLGNTLALTSEQIGMKTGMLTASIFPFLGIILLLFMGRYFAKVGKK